MSEMTWQPIETAPKDGSRLLLANEDSEEAYAGFWHPTFEEWADLEQDGGWQYPLHEPTPKYWMPFPKPPNVNRKGAEHD